MVEGHSVHRIASRFRAKLVGRAFAATSPNGRFAAGSAAIDRRTLIRIEAVGKNLFAFFSNPSSASGGDENEDAVVVHVHFGMSGAWAVFDRRDEPEVKPTTRLRLEEISSSSSSSACASGLVTHLSAMTVQHGDLSLHNTKKTALGEDPLRPDADPVALFERVSKSKKLIGALIMDQSYFAGPGNIYRAEILFLAGVYPTTPGAELDRRSFDRIWDASVKLLRRGYDTGSILTVDAELDPCVAARNERRYIYNRSRCARCVGPVRSWDMAGRTCYACEGGCQPKLGRGSSDDDSSASAASTATPSTKHEKTTNKVTPEAKERRQQHVPFISHCAPDNYRQRLAQHGPEKLTIAEIRSVLEAMLGSESLPPTNARKAAHVEALKTAMLENKAGKLEMETLALPPPAVSAEAAAREKADAGENRAVEHVAELSREQMMEAIAVTPSPSNNKKKAVVAKKRAHSRDKTVKNSRRMLKLRAQDHFQQRLAQHKPEKLTIAEIRSILEAMPRTGSLPPTNARKAVHVEALKTAMLESKAAKQELETMALPPPAVSAEAAAREKAVAGENRAVEHVAELSREQTMEAIAVTPSPSNNKRKATAAKKKAQSPEKKAKSSRRRLKL